ncbi:MAG: hypothetical protein Q8Q14_12265 [Gemmatimonadales bacterium]|nr:hypothetical protein [Gemmatimonadales bacterium]
MSDIIRARIARGPCGLCITVKCGGHHVALALTWRTQARTTPRRIAHKRQRLLTAEAAA